VIDRCADDRKAKRDVHRPAEREQLHGDEPLVVIAGDDGVELSSRGAAEDRVAGKRTLDRYATDARRFHRGA
jgi:hypothetical protein